MIEFRYQLDEVCFQRPWCRPDMERLALWYYQLTRAFEFSPEFEFWLAGGFWSNESGTSWDVDLFVVVNGNSQPDPYRSMDRTLLRHLYELVQNGISLAIEHHRFLLDVTATTEARLRELSRQFRLFERGEIERVSLAGKPDLNIGYGIHNYVMKSVNGEILFTNTACATGAIAIGDGKYLYKKQHLAELGKQTEYIRNGRIYYDPVRLGELFGFTRKSPTAQMGLEKPSPGSGL
jgi:hypothetical protein